MINWIKTIILTLVAAFGLFVPQFALASDYGLNNAAGKTGYDKTSTVESSVDKVVSTLLALLAIIFFVLITYAGVRWMTSRGNEEMATSAKETLETAVIGLIIVMSAYAITTFIFNRLEGIQQIDEPPLVLGCTAYTESTVCNAAAEGCIWDAGVCNEQTETFDGTLPGQGGRCIDQTWHYCSTRVDCGEGYIRTIGSSAPRYRCSESFRPYCCVEPAP